MTLDTMVSSSLRRPKILCTVSTPAVFICVMLPEAPAALKLLPTVAAVAVPKWLSWSLKCIYGDTEMAGIDALLSAA
ncbi:hypothetical protein DPV78_011708 [Talaromyces pinophilus]|nr:hypothetical protein DPV78_011708 [Talaromyces pinophilus]